jgi:heavy metal sensor kinase
MLMLRSFKLKIAFSSVLLTTLLLMGFGLFCVQMTWRVGLDRIDRELRALVDSDMRKSHSSKHWERFDEALKRMYSAQEDRQFVISVSDTHGALLFESPSWKEEIAPQTIPRSIPPEKEFENEPLKKKLKANQPEQPPRLAIGNPTYTTAGNWRVISIQNREVAIKLGLNLTPLHAELAHFWKALLLTIPISLLLMIVSGWVLAKLALRPVNTIAETTNKITALQLDRRIPQKKADHEFKNLIQIINRMLQRLEANFNQATRFSADAAHELKTPLTILQGQLEAALQSAPDNSDDQRTYKESLDEVQRLKSIIRKLLLLAQADSGRLPLHVKPIDFTQMLENLIEDIRILNPDLEVAADIQPGIAIEGDKTLIEQVIQNLASNAVKFSQGEPPVTLSLSADEQVEFTISNRGQTIAKENRGKIFERFYRTDQAHSRKTDGAGLGLSLAREIALAHGGSLELADSAVGWTTFVLRLPPNITEP